jgi:DNA-directed RNA polymerase specialized sigma24 family protein
MKVTASDEHGVFATFAAEAEPRLRRALAGARRRDDVPDAVAEALAYAWEHWTAVVMMENPHGYLYRVALSKSRSRRPLQLPAPSDLGLPDVEPGLVPALSSLTESQRAAVWLTKACGWTYREVAEALEISASAVGTHVERGMAALRAQIGDAS